MPLRGSGETILLMGGFVSSDVSGKQTLLGRNGSIFRRAHGDGPRRETAGNLVGC